MSELKLAPFASQVLGQGPFRLRDLAALCRPRWYHVWLLSDDCSRSPREDDRLERVVAMDWPDLSVWDRSRKEPAYSQRRSRVIAGRRREILRRKIWPALAEVIGSRDFVTKAIDATGRECEVPIRLAPQLVADLAGDTLKTSDGSFIWLAVTVHRTKASVDHTMKHAFEPSPGADTSALADASRDDTFASDSQSERPPVPPPPGPGRRPETRNKVEAWLRANRSRWGDKLAAIEKALASSGINASLKTIRRALKVVRSEPEDVRRAFEGGPK